MKDIFSLIIKEEETFKDFRKWLYLKLNKNTENFRKFAKYPNNLKLPYLLDYLENKGVNILEAACYYDAVSSNQASSFQELQYYVVVMEFKRIEAKKTINYVPF